MLKRSLLAFTFFLLTFSLLFAQNPLNFFPHHKEDLWEYWFEQYPGGGYSVVQNKITKDSLVSEGKYYIETTRFGAFILDTTTFEVYNWYGKLYKLDAALGDSWVVIEDTSGQNSPFIAVVTDVYQDILFSQPVTIKVVDYYVHIIALSESLWTQTYYLASNFGMVGRDVEFSYPEYAIKGAIIDSVLYGSVTSVEGGEEAALPNGFALHQNYPNPFNPVTTIAYTLPVAAQAELTVFDLLGRQVSTLVNARQPAGNYWVQFNGNDLSSGIYYYPLKIDGQAVMTRKMVLLK